MIRTPIRARAAVIAAALAFSPAWFAQQQTAPQDGGKPTVTTNAQEVLLDVVVRDKKGRFIPDLTKDQFQVTDDGQPVKPTSFRVVRSGDKVLRAVTMVFEHVDVQDRALAREAGMDVLKSEPDPEVYFAVFAIDQQMAAIQQFTRDRAALKKAIERATSGAFLQFAEDAAQVRKEVQQQLASASADANEKLLARAMLKMATVDQTMDRQEPGRAVIFSLAGLARSQADLPGRKSLLYFTRGLTVPDHLQQPFESLISTANRANVSVYALGVHGLDISAENAGANALLDSAAKQGSAAQTGADTHASPSQIARETLAVDQAVQGGRANVLNSLDTLSRQTGGFPIFNTNDLKAPLRRAAEDLESYYEISYTPDIKKYDGTFRKISVHTDVADARLQARSGYFALPPEASPDLLPYEMPLLAALGTMPLPRTFAFHATTMRFHPGKDEAQCAFLLEAPFKDLTLQEQGDSVMMHLGVVTLIKNSAGTVVEKFSQDVPVKFPADKKAGLQASNFIFNRHFELAPGRYTVESAVGDFLGNKVSARKAVLVVPVASTGVTLSNLSLVRSFQPNAAGTDDMDPFHFQGGKVTPSLDDQVHGGKGAKLSIFFVVYPDPAEPGKPELQAQLLQDGKPIGGGALDLPPAEKDGSIPYVASFPIDTLPAGQYQIRVIAKQGSIARDQTALFTIE